MTWTAGAFAVALSVIGGCAVLPNTALAQSTSATTRLSPQEGAQLAREMLLAGQPDAARDIAAVLVRSDPNSSAAHVLLAQASVRTGDDAAARDAARTAWRLADTPRERFIAAFTMADILAAQESYTRSQFWLRRAVQVAPTAQTERVAVEAFRRVRQENPLAIELSFGITPSSNVNSGNSNEAINFAFLPGPLGELQFLVPPDERPLSGLEITARTDLRYRIAQSERSRTSLELGLYGRTYVMSDEARATAPDVTGESLSFYQLSFGVLHQWVPEGADAPYSASLTFSHDWAGGVPFRFEVNGTLGTQFTLSDTDTLAVSGSLRYSQRLSSDTETYTYSLRSRWARALENDDVVGVTAQIARATSDSTDLAYKDATLGVSYDFGDLGFGVDLAASYTEQLRIYETSAFDPAGREDRISALRFDMGLNQIDFYGFQPVVTLQARRTDSSVARFDTEGAQLGINLRSSF